MLLDRTNARNVEEERRRTCQVSILQFTTRYPAESFVDRILEIEKPKQVIYIRQKEDTGRTSYDTE